MKEVSMDPIKKIQEDYKSIKNPKAVRVDELNALGYIVGKKEVSLIAPVYGKGAAFILVEVVYADNPVRQASFCYLFHVRANEGYVLPRPYHDYVDREPEPIYTWDGGTP
jgi:hypothetical protein